MSRDSMSVSRGESRHCSGGRITRILETTKQIEVMATYLPTYVMAIYLSTYLPTYLMATYLPTHIPTYIYTYLLR
jgi:hypothetical protein